MAINPCCGYNLRSGCKIVAIVDIVWCSLVFMAVLAITTIAIFSGISEQQRVPSQEPQQWDSSRFFNSFYFHFTVLCWVILLIFYVPTFVMGMILLKGAKEMNKKKLLLYVMFRGVMWHVMLFSLLLFWNPLALYDILITPYFMWVVVAFIQKITADENKKVVYTSSEQQVTVQDVPGIVEVQRSVHPADNPPPYKYAEFHNED